MKRIAVLGTAGIPAAYGGFETLAENLVRYHTSAGLPGNLVVYCSAKGRGPRPASYAGAELRYIPLNANGPVSVLYDAVSILSAMARGCDVILLLGVSGAFALPLVRFLSKTRVVTNVDGIEWKRQKWTGFARWWLRKSEAWAVRFSHQVIADNGGIAQHVSNTYHRGCMVIAYGGDHAAQAEARPYDLSSLPKGYALALCRIEPENNVETILAAVADEPKMPLVFIGNWDHSEFGRDLRRRYGSLPHVRLLNPIYDNGILRTIRAGASLYLHGHSAGGTNPSLVEIMHFGLPVIAYDCIFNRSTTEEQAVFFNDAIELRNAIKSLQPDTAKRMGATMLEIAQRRYTWTVVGEEYFKALNETPIGEVPISAVGGN